MAPRPVESSTNAPGSQKKIERERAREQHRAEQEERAEQRQEGERAPEQTGGSVDETA